jgi:hypothetical protein
MQRYNSMAGDVKLAREMMFKEIPNRPRLSLPLSDVIQLKVRYLKARSSGSLPCGRGEDTGVCRDYKTVSDRASVRGHIELTVVPCRFLRVNRHTAEVHRIHCLHRDIRPHIALVRSRFRWVQNIYKWSVRRVIRTKRRYSLSGMHIAFSTLTPVGTSATIALMTDKSPTYQADSWVGGYSVASHAC